VAYLSFCITGWSFLMMFVIVWLYLSLFWMKTPSSFASLFWSRVLISLMLRCICFCVEIGWKIV
jgi:hypothetical protein